MKIKTFPKTRALGLCSGGLDSILAGLLLQRNSIEPEWITYETPFFSASKARQAAKAHHIPLTVKNITSAYIPMLKSPPCGYGKYMNPCLDCHALMFRLAGEMMQPRQFKFLFSGEVVGQRPMSQTRPSLRYVEKHSGYDGYIIRPLSAKKLPVTIPEKEGWIDREKLLGLSGRTRKPQIELARQFGVTDYPAPAGGCLLTDKGYSTRLKDYFNHQDDWHEAELHLLKFGRHFRLRNDTKLIVGRTHKDNQCIGQFVNQKRDIRLNVKKFPGPLCILPYCTDPELVKLAASVCVGYSKAPRNTPVEVQIATPDGSETLAVVGVTPAEMKPLMI
ncbi:tRNA 4-thiouridine(8) synthase ThiI [Desulfococcaceae bacterium HSG9]|nr:tRNA 4-thiouridine(8) synthase ThiI [Desulfococcaceae bacterium HSG9]